MIPGVTLSTLTPGTPTLDATTGLSTISLSISATGGYFQLTEFLYTIETLPRAAKVQSVSLSPSGGDAATTVSNLLTLQATAIMFTSDQSAGPGSEPGPTEDSATEGA